MKNWGEEFAGKFVESVQRSRINNERKAQKQREVAALQGELWKQLRDSASTAVEQINRMAGSKILLFLDSEINRDFRIICSREGVKQAIALASFLAAVHAVSIQANTPSASRKEFQIVSGDNGQVQFSLFDTIYPVDNTVHEMLTNLL